MKFDLSTIVLIVIACMLAYITYVSMTMVKANAVVAKIQLGAYKKEDLAKVTLLESAPQGRRRLQSFFPKSDAVFQSLYPPPSASAPAP